MKLFKHSVAIIALCITVSTSLTAMKVSTDIGKESKESKEEKWAITTPQAKYIAQSEPCVQTELSPTIAVTSASDAKSASITITIPQDARERVFIDPKLIRHIASFLTGNTTAPNTNIITYLEQPTLCQINKKFYQALQTEDAINTLEILFYTEGFPDFLQQNQQILHAVLANAFTLKAYTAAEKLLEAMKRKKIDISVFRTNNNDTVLHMAARANHPALYKLIRNMAPRLNDSTNNQRQKPINLLSTANQLKVARPIITLSPIIPFAIALLIYLVPTLHCGSEHDLQELGDILLFVILALDIVIYKKVKKELHIKDMTCPELLTAIGFFITTLTCGILAYISEEL